MQLIEKLKSREKYLEELISKLSAGLSKREQVANIYAKKHKNGFQYYVKNDDGIKFIIPFA
ncbi:MAG: hypothetical protein KBS85_05310 [Lachnospiraceae bacterium]|nr:hypothetical protein [Candidatus Merdinaster equi]